MSYLLRLIAFCLAVWSPFAHAVIPATQGTEYSCGIAGWYPARSPACTAYMEYRNIGVTGFHFVKNATQVDASCRLDKVLDSGSVFYNNAACTYGTRAALTCPANSTLAGTSCTCNSGYQENSDSTSCLPSTPPPPPCDPPNVIRDGVCGPPDPPKCNYPPGAGMPDTLFQMGGGANYKGGYICYLNCEAVPDMRGQKDGKWFHWGPYTSTGATCANSTGDSTGGQPTPDNPDGVPPPSDPDAPPRDPPPPPPEPPPEQCKKGTCPGSINGTTVCMPCQETRSPQPVPGAPPKAPPTPPDPTGNNAPPDTQKTTQSATNCKDGKCTTTTTTSTTDANGVTTTNSNSKTESKDDFCATNPRSSMCLDGVFGGSCEAGFVCEGDAVQCAQAKAAYETKCAWEKVPDGVQEAYDSVANDSWLSELHTNGPALVTPTPVTGSCALSDFNVSLIGGSISVPISRFCQYMDVIRAMIGVLGALAFAVIVFKG